MPPGVADIVREGLHEVGIGADVPGGQVLLEGEVREGVPAGGHLDEQAVARDVVEERLAGDRRGEALKRALEYLDGAVGGEVADVVAHHLVGERGQQHLLGGPGQELRQALGLSAAREQHLADLAVQVGAAAGQRAAVPVRRGDHRQQQRIDRQVQQGRVLPEQGGEPGGGLAGPHPHGAPRGPARGAGRVPFRRQVPAVEEELHLLRRERPDHEDVRVGGQRVRQPEGPGGDHEVVAGVGGDLPLDPVGHGAAVLGAGHLVKAVEQDQAPAAAQLALPPAAGLLARGAADRGPHHVRQRDRRVGDDRPRPARAARAGRGRACGQGVRPRPAWRRGGPRGRAGCSCRSPAGRRSPGPRASGGRGARRSSTAPRRPAPPGRAGHRAPAAGPG